MDYRVLNSKTIPATFPIPLLNEMLDRLKGEKYFTVIDIKSAYYNIEVEESDQSNATITQYDLSPRFFCIDATLLCQFESNKI